MTMIGMLIVLFILIIANLIVGATEGEKPTKSQNQKLQFAVSLLTGKTAQKYVDRVEKISFRVKDSDGFWGKSPFMGYRRIILSTRLFSIDPEGIAGVILHETVHSLQWLFKRLGEKKAHIIESAFYKRMGIVGSVAALQATRPGLTTKKFLKDRALGMKDYGVKGLASNDVEEPLG